MSRICCQPLKQQGFNPLKFNNLAFILISACAASTGVSAQSPAHSALLSQFQSSEEKTAKDAAWTSGSMFKVGVLDDGSRRDGYAAYVCQVAAQKGLKNFSVQIFDVAKLKITNKVVVLGEKRCS